MAELVETYWTLVPDYAQIIGHGGALLTVTPAVRELYPLGQWDRVTMVQPDMGDALVTLMLAFPGSTIMSAEETES